VNVQHLPGWDREVHSPQPEGQPGPRHRDQHGVVAPPLRLDHRAQRGDVPTLSPPETPRSSVSYAEVWWPSAITAQGSMSVNTKPVRI
jgi:hypothetical protein